MLRGTNYLAYSAAMTPLIVLIVDGGRAPESSLLVDRLVATVLGAALVVAANLGDGGARSATGRPLYAPVPVTSWILGHILSFQPAFSARNCSAALSPAKDAPTMAIRPRRDRSLLGATAVSARGGFGSAPPSTCSAWTGQAAAARNTLSR